MHDRLIDLLIAQAQRHPNPTVKLVVTIDIDRPNWNIRTENDILSYAIHAPIKRDNLKSTITAAVNYCWSEYILINPQH